MQFCNEQTRAQPLFSPPCASATYGSARMSRRKNCLDLYWHLVNCDHATQNNNNFQPWKCIWNVVCKICAILYRPQCDKAITLWSLGVILLCHQSQWWGQRSGCNGTSRVLHHYTLHMVSTPHGITVSIHTYYARDHRWLDILSWLVNPQLSPVNHFNVTKFDPMPVPVWLSVQHLHHMVCWVTEWPLLACQWPCVSETKSNKTSPHEICIGKHKTIDDGRKNMSWTH